VPWGHWGSCAVVAPAASSLAFRNGAEIDAHDLVSVCEPSFGGNINASA
jgi:hypothetical protein